MLAITSRSRHRQKLEKEYQEMLELPYHRLLTCLLEMALTTESGVVVLGFRDPVVEAKAFREFPPYIPPQDLTDSVQRAFRAGTHLTGPNQAEHVPVWLEHQGELQLFQFIAVGILPHLAAAIDERLVSIDGTKDAPQPLRYIEIKSNGDSRRFAEIGIELDRNNLYWIRVLSDRTASEDANISRYYY